jgi:hypothetical protein
VTDAIEQRASTATSGDEVGTVDLFWIPLGAGGHSVRFNGIVYESATAIMQRRTRCALYHSALAIELPEGRYMVEMTPVPDRFGDARGVVAAGPVGLHVLDRFRIFRYEIRRWRDGIVPDLGYAVASPVRVTSDPSVARRVFDALPNVPTLVWGLDELRAGDMWSCNSITSWALATAGVDVACIPFPPTARAPGWDAGIVAARGRIRGETAVAGRWSRACRAAGDAEAEELAVAPPVVPEVPPGDAFARDDDATETAVAVNFDDDATNRPPPSMSCSSRVV